MAGTPRRKNAAKLTATSTSISASVATIPARPAAAIVVPFACDVLLATAVDTKGAGSFCT
jgi:hypothetical protein